MFIIEVVVGGGVVLECIILNIILYYKYIDVVMFCSIYIHERDIKNMLCVGRTLPHPHQI